jgi:hypothetical protein
VTRWEFVFGLAFTSYQSCKNLELAIELSNFLATPQEYIGTPSTLTKTLCCLFPFPTPCATNGIGFGGSGLGG